MKVVANRSVALSLPIYLAVTVFVGSASGADTLTAMANRVVVEVGEPIVLDVTLRLEKAVREVPDDPRQLTNEARRLKHHLVAELWTHSGRVAVASIGGTRFVGEEGAIEVTVRVVGWFGVEEPAKPHSRFTFWTVPGDYQVVVKSEDGGLVASPFVLKILPPQDQAAVDALVREGLDALALLLLQHEYGASAVPAFEHVSREFPDTVPGQYARAVLALREGVRLRRGIVQRNEGDPQLLRTDLEKVVESFDAGHPYRSQALFELAWLLAGNGQTDLAVDITQQVILEARTAETKEGAQELSKAILRRNSSGTGADRR